MTPVRTVRRFAVLGAAAALLPGSWLLAREATHAPAARQGTLIVAGRVFEAPFTLVRTGSDVEVGGVAVSRALAEAREAMHAPATAVAPELEARHAVGIALAQRRGELDSSLSASERLEQLALAALASPVVLDASVIDGGLLVEWRGGGREVVLLPTRASSEPAPSAEQRFHARFDEFAKVLERGGVVALGPSFAFTATGDSADAVRDAIAEGRTRGFAADDVQRRLEAASGGRALGRDLLRANEGR